MIRPALLLACLLFCGRLAHAQSPCPANIDFEAGVFNGWECAIATNNGNGTPVWAPMAAIANRHTITSGTGLDPYGNFPVVAPGGGMYSVKLGNNASSAQMDQIRYKFQVPPTAGIFNLVYRYAVVLQDGGHPANVQPYFEVKVTDSATGNVVPCNHSTYVTTSNLPGFTETGPGTDIWYKPWTAASMRLTGLSGSTLYIEFTTADCSQGGHFGYGYVDVNCGGYAVTSANCNNAAATPLTGPPGFMQYDWYDANFGHVGSGQTITVPSPAPSNTYNVVVIPYPGYGCIDTLTTTILYSTLAVDATPDTSYLCGAGAAQLQAHQVGSSPPYTYGWAPFAGLSCISCPNPLAAPGASTVYVLTVTDAAGCAISDSVLVNANMSLFVTQYDVSCFGGHNGSATITPTGGKPPYTYSWNTAPTLNSPTLSNLSPGNYIATVTDANNCSRSITAGITQPALLKVAGTATHVTCGGGSNGALNATATGGVAPYSFSWNGDPPTATGARTGLTAGVYTCIVTDTNGCTATTIQTITQPPTLVVHITTARRPCFGQPDGLLVAAASGGTGAYTWRWGPPPYVSTDTFMSPPPGPHRIEVFDATGCMATDSVTLLALPLPNVNAGADAEICRGGQTTLNAIGSGATTYTWSPGTGLSCTACTQTIATTDTTTAYVLTGKDANGCTNTDTITVNVIQRVPVSVDSLRHICPGDRIVLGASGGEGYEWTPKEYLTGNNIPNPVAAPDSTITYRVIITENKCFKDTLYQTVIVMPKPSVRLGEDFAGLPGATVKLETIVSGEDYITWYPPAGLSCTNCYAPVAMLDSTITYIAEVTNVFGCKARDTITIRVACDENALYAANTFTPNGDGQNDYFYPQGLGVNTVKRMMVYDRWGEIVFSAADIPANVPDRGWNGTFRGKALAPDVFLFVIETLCKNGTPIVLKGDITLVR